MNLPPEYENSPFVKEPMSEVEKDIIENLRHRNDQNMILSQEQLSGSDELLKEFEKAVKNGETNNYVPTNKDDYDERLDEKNPFINEPVIEPEAD